MGIDLAAGCKNDTGICIINDHVELYTVKSNEEIKELTEGIHMIAIDAPLTSETTSFRSAERELMKEYGPLLPLNMEGMKKLAERGLKLSEEMGCEVIETYPRAVERSLDMDIEDLKIDVDNEHEYDAYLCSIAAKHYYEGEYRSFGEGEEVIIVP